MVLGFPDPQPFAQQPGGVDDAHHRVQDVRGDVERVTGRGLRRVSFEEGHQEDVERVVLAAPEGGLGPRPLHEEEDAADDGHGVRGLLALRGEAGERLRDQGPHPRLSACGTKARSVEV
ncbi:hypothetical protein GCM10020000_13910 [Streptomyces olivoverticillatus]